MIKEKELFIPRENEETNILLHFSSSPICAMKTGQNWPTCAISGLKREENLLLMKGGVVISLFVFILVVVGVGAVDNGLGRTPQMGLF